LNDENYGERQLAQLGTSMDTWARETLFDPAHQTATRLLDEAVDIHLIHLYRTLHFHDHLQSGQSARQLTATLEFEPSADIALDAMLRRLASRHEFLSLDESGDDAVYIPISEPADQSHALPAITQKMGALGQNYLATLEFLAFGADHFTRSLRDDHNFMDRVLTGQEKQFADTWHRATNTDPLQDIHGIMGAKAVELVFTGGTILEVGGGTGNGLFNNLKALQTSEQLGSLSQYVFTDVSMHFILNTKRAMANQYPSDTCTWRLLNINKDWGKQRIDENSMNLIYGVNAAHIAMETVDFMKECLRALADGGAVVFSERIRPTPTAMAPREIVLNQSLYHRTAAVRHPEYRPAHAYLTRDNWLRACELAGFTAFAVWPSTGSLNDYFPEQYAAVLVAYK
jgi:SAM-dependent methyltransferase